MVVPARLEPVTVTGMFAGTDSFALGTTACNLMRSTKDVASGVPFQ